MGSQEETSIDRPLGLSIVAVFTLLGSFAIFLLFAVGNLLALVGGAQSGGVNWLYWWMVNPTTPISLGLAVYAFSISICLFVLRTRTVWYASVIFWSITLLFFLWWGLIIWRTIGESLTRPMAVYTFYLLGEVMLTLAPLVYTIVCLTYFQTRRIRNYFHLTR